MESYSTILENTIIEDTDYDKKILIVEDDDVSFMLLDEILSSRNISPTRANNGSEAIDHFKKNKNAFDLVLMDIRMPNINGYEATRQIKEINPKVPIVAVTAYTHSQGVIECYDSGCDDFIAKPFDIGNFLKTVENYLILKN